MAALIEVGDLHENVDRRGKLRVDEAIAHEDGDDEGFGRSYVCSMPSVIDLQCQGNGNCVDLALNVQRYLSRIVEELHLISVWSSNLYPHQQQQHRNRYRQQNVSSTSPLNGNTCVRNNSLTSMARLAAVTDIELMRRDVAKAQYELFQRCTTQITYVQNEVNVAISKQGTLYSELVQLMNDNVRAWSQHAQSIEALEKSHGENDMQMRTINTTLRQVQQQIAAHPTRIAVLEKSVATMAAAQFSHEQELQALQRQVESHDATHNVQLEISRRAAEDSLAELCAANSQLSATMQVVQLEMQKQYEAQQRTQHLLKAVGLVAGSTSGKPHVTPTPGVTPQRPSVTTSRTARPLGGHAAPKPHIRSGKSEVNSSSSDDFLGLGSCAPRSLGTVTLTDCFIYAKAALPHRHSTTQTNTTASKPSSQSIGSSRVTTGYTSANVTPTGGSNTTIQGIMNNLLKVQQSVMSMPLGYEDDTRPATGRQDFRDNDTRVSEHTTPTGSALDITRQNSLPYVNLRMEQGSHSPYKLPLNTKLRHTTSSTRNL